MKARILTDRTRNEMLKLNDELNDSLNEYSVVICAIPQGDTHSAYLGLLLNSKNDVLKLFGGNDIKEVEIEFYKAFINLTASK